MTTYPVTLYVYDISQGMAKAMSQMIVGKLVEGIWHTSVVVHNKEYYFQGGTFGDTPKSTPFGQPVKEIALGVTEVSKEEIDDYVLGVQEQFSAQTYDIFKNNCNHYSNNLAEFLVGSEIPAEYLNQAKEFENTPIGNFIKSMNEAMKNQVVSNHQGMNLPPQHNLQAPQQGQKNGGPSAHVTLVHTTEQYLQFITENRLCVIDFGAKWCGPCRMMKPIFEGLAAKYSGKVAFAEVDIDKATELAQSINVRSVPLFLLLKDQNEFGRVLGANQGQLTSSIENLSKQ